MKDSRRAAILFRPHRHYRRELFESGLRRLGFSVSGQPAQAPGRRDVLVLWNRPRHQESIARNYEKRGGTVLVVENGYLGRSYFAMARSQHNGAGRWREGGPERWDAMKIGLDDWRTDGSFVVVLPQRGIGAKGVAMPKEWTRSVAARLSRMTERVVRIRPHPGSSKIEPYEDLRGAWAAVTWGSGAGIKALVAGIPVFHALPEWIGAPAARKLDAVESLETPFLGDRLPMFRRLAWAQFSPDEIESGWTFEWLLG